MVKGKKKIKGICFRQDSLSLIHGNTFIYCLRTRCNVKRFIHRFLLCNCLLGAVSLINSCDPNIYVYSGNGAE